MSNSPQCPKCRALMEEGFVLDHVHMDSRHVGQWVEGPPEKSFWMGLKLGDRRTYKVATFRCQGCGFLESYVR